VASGFEKCKFLKDEFGKSLDGKGLSVIEAAKPKKPHHDEA
jgi:hypothetical protein